MKRREAASNEEMARVEEDVDSLPPPPADDGYEDGRNPLLAAPKPAPRKGHSQDVLVSLMIAMTIRNIFIDIFESFAQSGLCLIQLKLSQSSMNNLLFLVQLFCTSVRLEISSTRQ